MSDLESDILRITARLQIRRRELSFRFSRSGGPGGQNINKVSTRVTLRFDVAASGSLSDAQRTRIGQRLRTRITRAGVLQIVSAKHRTQAANRRAAVERFIELVSQAVRPVKRRKQTAVPRWSRAQRRDGKARSSQRKQLRRRPTTDE